MDEYIKREDAIKHLRGACIAKYPLSFSYGIFASADEISKLPTADVVPKSEYDAVVSAVDNSTKEFLKLHDAYQEQKAEIERLQKALDEYEETSGLKQAKAEVAREIFEEIEEYAELQIESLNIAEKIASRGADFFGGGKQAFVLLLDRLAELKKKYTEGNNDEN